MPIPIAQAMLDAARQRTAMVVSALGVRATAAEATICEIKKHELYSEKLRRDGRKAHLPPAVHTVLKFKLSPIVAAALVAPAAAAAGVGAAAEGAGGAQPAWAMVMQAGISRIDARMLNRDAVAPTDALYAFPGVAAPFAMPAAALQFPADLAAFALLTLIQANALLAFYGLLAPGGVGAGVARAASLARLGTYLGIRMDNSWEKDMERRVNRAANASAHVAAHALVPLRGPQPPFGYPAGFPATSDDLRNLPLANARALCDFYALPPRAHNAAELATRRNDLAAHIGLRL